MRPLEGRVEIGVGDKVPAAVRVKVRVRSRNGKRFKVSLRLRRGVWVDSVVDFRPQLFDSVILSLWHPTKNHHSPHIWCL